MKNIFSSKKIEKNGIFTFLQISLMTGLTEDTRFSYLLLHAVCYGLLFWLKKMKIIWPHTDV